jgi:hypothetical protein
MALAITPTCTYTTGHIYIVILNYNICFLIQKIEIYRLFLVQTVYIRINMNLNGRK